MNLRIVALLSLALLACRRHGHGGAPLARSHAQATPDGASASGLFWARFADVPDGMRVQLWLDSDGHRVRGAYSATPYIGEVEGSWGSEGTIHVHLLERGVTRAIGARVHDAVMHREGTGWAGADDTGAHIDWRRAGFVSPTLRPGVWVSRWTGLPPGIAVETRLTRMDDGRWRAVYQYQGTGGIRDGSFEGTDAPGGGLALAWTEMAESGTMARGRGALQPTVFGLRGTFGIDGSTEGTGEWTLEPMGE